jgi:diamine N-acetyltransferase
MVSLTEAYSFEAQNVGFVIFADVFLLMLSMSFSYYVAGEADREALRTFAERLFVETYAAQNTPDNMALYCQEAFSEENFTNDYNRSEVRYLVARTTGELAAYTKLVLGKTPPGKPAPPGVEIARFYVDSAFRGKGLAREFMAYCQQWVQRQGYSYVWLGVWPQNPRAVRFYQKEGFEKAGTATFVLGTDPQTDDILTKPF